ncbi:MAG: D-cysteine desulfhydrase family protein [Anaerolineales bacterium]|nr:D-cysteine desulfhydrase family protein [Anaerolineales bacterium]
MPDTPLPRLRFAHLPTPIEPLPRLSAALGGPALWAKRDDQTGLAFGGNKTRKLEYLLAEAQSHGGRTLVTTGARQSNHCRQTAAAAARFGFGCILVLAGSRPEGTTGNLLLDSLLGAELVWTEGEDRQVCLQRTFDKAWSDGRRPYLIPYGGSSPLGAAAYAQGMAEFLSQGQDVDRIVFATSSGGTQAGLVAGARIHGFGGRVTGISVDEPAEALRAKVASLAGETASLLGHSLKFEAGEIEVDDRYLGDGYGVMGEREREAIELFARAEGLLLDPVYTGRAAGGLIDMVRRGEIGRQERVLFWHTGGTPALFAYADRLAPPDRG